jgi:hypothetical protein
MHHVKHIRKSNTKLKGFHELMSRLNRQELRSGYRLPE